MKAEIEGNRLLEGKIELGETLFIGYNKPKSSAVENIK